MKCLENSSDPVPSTYTCWKRRHERKTTGSDTATDTRKMQSGGAVMLRRWFLSPLNSAATG